jgi:hypothetical protein
MATDHLHYPTGTGEAAPTTHPQHTSETRKNDDTTPEAQGTIPNPSRRRLLIMLGGAVAVVAAGGGGGAQYLFGRSSNNTETFRPPVAPPAPERREPIPESELTLNAIHMPETLNPPRFEDVVANLGLAVQFAVNHNDQAGLTRYIPGGETGVLMPEPFQLRAAFIDGLRRATPGEVDDINAPRYYPWGFSMEMQELITSGGFNNPQDPNLNRFTAQVRLRMGDLPPRIKGEVLPPTIEQPIDYTTNVTFTRWQGHLDANNQYVRLPNLDGQPGDGWGIMNAYQMYPIPTIMTGLNLPRSFSSVPPIFNPHPPK